MTFNRQLAVALTALLVTPILSLPSAAETVARANGRCLLKEQNYQLYNGFCSIKQKANGGTTIFVVDLENGNRFRFAGPNRQQLHVETSMGIQQNVLFEDRGSSGVFSWNDGNSTYRLAVKTDTVTNPNAQFDDHHSTSVGATVAGAAVGALIGALLGGGRSNSGSSGQEGQPVADLQNLVGADPGYVESRLTSAGYTYIQSSPRENGTDSYWKRGGACLDVRSILNRYESFTYANPSRCR